MNTPISVSLLPLPRSVHIMVIYLLPIVYVNDSRVTTLWQSFGYISKRCHSNNSAQYQIVAIFELAMEIIIYRKHNHLPKFGFVRGTAHT